MGDTDYRIAIVTGGAGGLGVAIAGALLETGHKVVLTDLSEEALRQVREKEFKNSEHVLALQCDVVDRPGVEDMVSKTVAAFGHVDALVNCAGVGKLTPFLEMAPDRWEQTIAVNLTGTFHCSQVVAKEMIRRRSGRIVNIASISGMRAGFGRAAYGTSKAAVIHFTKQLAVELGPYGITVNGVGPGPVDTELAIANHSPEMREDYHTMIPLARYGTPEEIGDAVAYLCSDGARYVNGQTLFVDGGFLAGGVAVRAAQDSAKT